MTNKDEEIFTISKLWASFKTTINNIIKMEGIKVKFENFINANKNSILLNKEEVIKEMNKFFSMSTISTKANDIKKIINPEEILFLVKPSILFTQNSFLVIPQGFGAVQTFPIQRFLEIDGKPCGIMMGNITLNGNVIINLTSGGKSDMFELFDKIKLVITQIKEELSLIEADKLLEIEEQIRANKIEKEQQKNKLISDQISILNQLDENRDGLIDLIENSFVQLISKNQKQIIEIDKSYIHQFVKISNYIKIKEQNTQKIFESIRDTSSQEELEERVSLLKNQIHSYELLVFHSINMIGALVSEDLITFYEIYESFDKLSIFNSNWENEVSEKLTNIGDKLDDLMYSIYNMEQNIVSELSHLSYVTQESFEDLNRSVTGQLKEIESSINTNNLLTGIQAYQLYKINKNTKGLRQ